MLKTNLNKIFVSKKIILLFVILIFAIPVTFAQLPKSKPMDETTREVWKKYYYEDDPPGTESVKLAARIKRLDGLNFTGVDPKIIQYFRLLRQVFVEEMPVLKLWDKDNARAASEQRAFDAQKAEDCKPFYRVGEPCDRDAGTPFDGIKGFSNFMSDYNWQNRLDAVKNKYLPEMMKLTKEVELREQTEYYSSIFDGSANNNFVYGKYMLNEGNIDEGILGFKSAIRYNPEHLWVHHYLGLAYARKGELQKAITHLTTQLTVNNKNPEITHYTYYMLGFSNFGLTKYSEALVNFQEAIKMLPNDVDTLFGLAKTLQAMEKFPEALIQYQKIIKLAPKETSAYLRMGEIYLKSGQKNAALEQYKILQKVDPEKANILLKQLN